MIGANEKITNIAVVSLVLSCIIFVFMVLLKTSGLITLSWWCVFGVLVLPYTAVLLIMVFSILFFVFYRLFFSNGKKQVV